MAGFAASGLFPFDPNRVLRNMRKLVADLVVATVDEITRQDLQMHPQKYAKAAQLSFAKGALQQNHIQLLLKINNEAKVRQSTKPLILGRA
jgi:hypothetical protein